jgi:hypothetical protein
LGAASDVAAKSQSLELIGSQKLAVDTVEEILAGQKSPSQKVIKALKLRTVYASNNKPPNRRMRKT